MDHFERGTPRAWASGRAVCASVALASLADRTVVFRLGHIGWFDVFDITTALAGVELALADAGADIERGVAVTRALEAYEQRVTA